MKLLNYVTDLFIESIQFIDERCKNLYNKICTILFYKKLSIIEAYNTITNRKFVLYVDSIDPYMTNKHFDYLDTMVYVNFQMLQNFVEKGNIKCVDWGFTKQHAKAHKTMIELYEWWLKYKDFRDKQKTGWYLKNIGVNDFPKLSDFFVKKSDGNYIMKSKKPRRAKYRKYYQCCDLVDAMEKEYNKQLNKNLHKLIDIREFLWV